MIPKRLPSSFSTKAWLGALLGAILCTPAAWAQDSGISLVRYNPPIKEVQGQIPFSENYVLQVTSPITLPIGTTATVSLAKTVNGFKPAGVTDAVALSYLTFSQTSLTFTGPNQTQNVSVTFSAPANAAAGSYGYKITTTGWPLIAGLVNDGSFINATVTVAPVANPPAVTIATPTDGYIVSVTPPQVLPVNVPFQFTAVSSGTNASPITSVDADLDGNAVTGLTITGLNTLSVSVSGVLRVTTFGTKVVTARATNASGTANDVNSFLVRSGAAAPTVTIGSPASGSTFTYRRGSAPLAVPFSTTAVASSGGIKLITATLDGNPLPLTTSNLMTQTATGTATLPFDSDDEGTHVLTVTAIDIYDQLATATTSFSVDVIEPTPTVAISSPVAGQVFTLASGSTTMNVPYTFTSTSNNGFVVDSVGATLGSTVLAPSSTGIGTSAASSSGSLAGLGVGTYTLTASTVSAGITVTTNVQFSVRAATVVPPSVMINTPTANSTFTIATGTTSTIPLTFTGMSNTSDGVITAVSAKLGSTNLPVTATLNTKTVNASSVMTVSAAGTYTITVTATDAAGTASASRTFTVNVVKPMKVAGEVFFDVDRDGRNDCREFPLVGVALQLRSTAGQIVASTVTDSCGRYSFNSVLPGSYSIVAVPDRGLVATTSARSITVSGSNVCAADIGLGLDFAAIRTMRADGKSHGFWKSNLDKAISGKTSGIQVSPTALNSYTRALGDFALNTYDCISMKSASTVLGSTSSRAKDLLSKQLIASEYNYQAGNYINGSRVLTFLFVYWGEYVLENADNCSSTSLIWAKDWFDAYNNSYGDLVDGPR